MGSGAGALSITMGTTSSSVFSAVSAAGVDSEEAIGVSSAVGVVPSSVDGRSSTLSASSFCPKPSIASPSGLLVGQGASPSTTSPVSSGLTIESYPTLRSDESTERVEGALDDERERDGA